MKPLRITGQFKKDFRACKKRGFRMKKLEDIIDKLRRGEPLSPQRAVAELPWMPPAG
jgi:mRNA-degrading endonuclease YafQ of YafQ-DinJ toxin-antitoxin module